MKIIKAGLQGTARGFLRCTVAALALVAMNAHAWEPERPIRLLSGFAPGGALDVVARLFAQRITEKHPGWNFVVDNKSGADGRIAAQDCSQSPPDGYTICMGASSTNAIHAGIFKTLPYDLVADFTPLFFVGSSANAFVVKSESPITSLSDLVEYAKRNPDKVSYATAGMGTSGQISGEWFNELAGVRLLHVPYRGGGPAVTAALGDQTTVLIANISNVENLIRQGKMRALAVTSDKREQAFPDVPTVAELGFPGFAVNNWYGFFAPANLPADVLETLHARLKEVAELPDVQEFLAQRGVGVRIMTQSEFRDFQRADIDKYKEVAHKAGIQVE